jgi:hypothetical protein
MIAANGIPLTRRKNAGQFCSRIAGRAIEREKKS